MDINDLLIDESEVSNDKYEQQKKVFINGKFVKGPIPLAWILKACSLGGNVAQVSWLLWFYYGLTNGEPITLSNIKAEEFGLERRQKTEALSRLEEAGLITIEQAPGKAPIVKLINTDLKQKD